MEPYKNEQFHMVQSSTNMFHLTGEISKVQDRYMSWSRTGVRLSQGHTVIIFAVMIQITSVSHNSFEITSCD